MQKSKQDSLYVNVATPYESAEFRPFADPEINDYRYFHSQDIFITPGGVVKPRPKFAALNENAANKITGKRIDRVWVYQTLPDASGVIYEVYLMSVLNNSTSQWEMYYQQVGVSGTMVQFTNLRAVNNSTAPHIVGFLKGKAFIRGFPSAASGEKLGSIIFDFSGGTAAYRWWGLLGPTTPARITGWIGKLDAAVSSTATSWTVSATTAPPATPFVAQCETEIVNVTAKAGAGPYTLTVTRGHNGSKAAAHAIRELVLYRDWAASDHRVSVSHGWQYAYSYETNTKHISCRSDVERNQDLMPSNTGPFADLKPKVTLVGDADTTNIPNIIVWRTSDGGGNFVFLERIANPGAGAFTYTDDSHLTGASSSTGNDPVPDDKLDTSFVAPNLTDNLPPPTVNAPLIVGTDTPSQNCTLIETFAGRPWYAIDNILYYGGKEEIVSGNPEECFPSGNARPNRMEGITHRIINLKRNNQALYVMTTGPTYIVTGTDKATFASREIATKYPAIGYDAACAFSNFVAFLTASSQLAVIYGESVDILSEKVLGVGAGKYTHLDFYSDGQHQWLMALAPTRSGATCRMDVYDFQRSKNENRDFWFPPWFLNQVNCFLAHHEQTNGARTIVGIDGTGSPDSTSLGLMQFTDIGQSLPDRILVNDAWSDATLPDYRIHIGPFKNPAGNHWNVSAIAARATSLWGVQIDFKASAGVFTVKASYDNGLNTFSATALSGPKDPTDRPVAFDYTTKEWRAFRVTQDFALDITIGTITASWQILRAAIVVTPMAGREGSAREAR